LAQQVQSLELCSPYACLTVAL